MIAFLIGELDIRGGTHKQFLKLLDYTSKRTDDFKIITYRVDYAKTYPGFAKYKDKIYTIPDAQFRFRQPINSISRIKESRRELRKLLENVDIINVHDCGMEFLFPEFKHKKMVWQVNDLPGAFALGASSRQKQNSLKNRLLKKLYVRYSRYADIFTVNVNKNRDRISNVFNRDARVLYCGIEPVGVTSNTDESLQRFDSRKINILSSGVFLPYRNYETQIRVVKLLVKKGIDVHLRIIGSTSLNPAYAESIRRMIDEDGLADRITICGMVDEDRFRELHEQSDLFMFINIDQSWGLAVFEAMSCGIPVIVSNSVGATEILTDNENAIFVNPTDENEIADRIISLMNNPEKYRKLSEVSSEFHENYTWDSAYSSKMFELLK